MISSLQLPMRFQPELLRRDLAAIPSGEWTKHYNQADYGGDWRGAALRSKSGNTRELFAGAAEFHDTPLLEACPYFREVMAAFDCPLKSVRLLSLAPGSFIREHTDNALDFEDGEVRIHVPIQTNPDVEFYVAGERLLLEEGGAYYLNVNLPHRVNNRGECDRIHLVIDAKVNDWVRELFSRGGTVARSARPPRGVREFREHVFRDAAMEASLRGMTDLHGFEREAVRLSSDGGFDIHEGDIGAALQGPAPEAAADWRPSREWIPLRFLVRDGKPWAEWIKIGDRRFTEPFFEDTVRACMTPFVRFSRCEAPLPDPGDAPGPRGFLFHMSRCGSTLASQMFAALPLVTMLSEPPPLDGAIQSGDAEWVRRMVLALTRGAGDAIVKLDAWHIRALPLVRAAFPSTPWVFLFRDPAAVVASQLRSPGRHCVRGFVDPALLGVDPAGFPIWDREGWSAGVIAAIASAALPYREEPGGLFVDYAELPDAVFSRMAPHFGITLSEAEREGMMQVTRFDAKNPGMPFSAARKTDERVAGLVERFGLARIYEQLRSGVSRQKVSV